MRKGARGTRDCVCYAMRVRNIQQQTKLGVNLFLILLSHISYIKVTNYER